MNGWAIEVLLKSFNLRVSKLMPVTSDIAAKQSKFGRIEFDGRFNLLNNFYWLNPFAIQRS